MEISSLEEVHVIALFDDLHDLLRLQTIIYEHFSHIDRQPLGDLPGTMVTLIMGNPDIHFVYCHRRGREVYILDTDEIKREIEDVPINHIEVLKFIRHDVADGLKGINAEA